MSDRNEQRHRHARHGAQLGAAVTTALLLTVTACGADETETTSDTASETTTPGSPATSAVSAAPGAPQSDAAPAADLASWQTTEATDSTGAVLTIADLLDRPVVVENFATWCSNCRKQLADTQKAASQLGDRATVLALSIETDIDPDDLAGYAEDNGFDDIRFAVMSPEMLAAFNDAFGKASLTAPSTPKVIVAADGTAGELTTGFETPSEIVAAVEAVL